MTFDRVLANLQRFETALQMAYGCRPKLARYSDLIQELKQELGSGPEGDDLQAIDALKPILARLDSATPKVS